MGLTGFGEMLPYRDNRVTLNNEVKDINGLPTLTMDVTIRQNELNMRKDMQASAVEMMEAAGFKNVRAFDRPYAPGLGIHEMGTARMGRDPKTSVLNSWNQVHACTNVYVTDGARDDVGSVREPVADLHGADGAGGGSRRQRAETRRTLGACR